MDVTPVIPDGLQVIDSYGPGRFRVSGILWSETILVTPEITVACAAGSMADLNADKLSGLFEAEPPVEVLLIGCGERMEMVASSFKRTCRTRGVGVDTMDTGAACRTYNVLLAEGRRVAALLIPLE